MKKRIITLGREFGSGGHTIGMAAAKRLNIPFYDEEIIERIARHSRYDEEFIRMMDKAEAPGRTKLSYLLSGRDQRGNTINDYIYRAQCEAVHELTQEGPFLLVGRCGDQILKDRDDVLKVFVFANLEWRKARILRKYGETKVPIDKRVSEKDQRRAAGYLYHTGVKWGQKENYDICLDSSSLTEEACIEIICHMYEWEYGDR